MYFWISGGGKIGIDENMIADQDPSLLVSGIFDHCRRLRLFVDLLSLYG